MKILKIVLLVASGIAFAVAAVLFFFGGDSSETNPQDETKKSEVEPEVKTEVKPE